MSDVVLFLLVVASALWVGVWWGRRSAQLDHWIDRELDGDQR